MSNIFCLVVSTITSFTSTFMESVKNGLLFMKIRCGGMVYLPLSNCVKPYFLMSRIFDIFKSGIRFIGFNHFQRRKSLLFGKNHNICRICLYINCVKNFFTNLDFCGIDSGGYLGGCEERK